MFTPKVHFSAKKFVAPALAAAVALGVGVAPAAVSYTHLTLPTTPYV